MSLPPPLEMIPRSMSHPLLQRVSSKNLSMSDEIRLLSENTFKLGSHEGVNVRIMLHAANQMSMTSSGRLRKVKKGLFGSLHDCVCDRDPKDVCVGR